MEAIEKIDTVDRYNKMRRVATRHPLVSVIDLSKAQPLPAGTFNMGLYAVYLKQIKCGELRYGRNYYDYQEGTLVLPKWHLFCIKKIKFSAVIQIYCRKFDSHYGNSLAS